MYRDGLGDCKNDNKFSGISQNKREILAIVFSDELRDEKGRRIDLDKKRVCVTDCIVKSGFSSNIYRLHV